MLIPCDAIMTMAMLKTAWCERKNDQANGNYPVAVVKSKFEHSRDFSDQLSHRLAGQGTGCRCGRTAQIFIACFANPLNVGDGPYLGSESVGLKFSRR